MAIVTLHTICGERVFKHTDGWFYHEFTVDHITCGDDYKYGQLRDLYEITTIDTDSGDEQA